ncbi:hypothetical protein [Paenibacillus sp. 2TAB19]|uniref:hypothetical protein n=1 Tax=Paenibacillus sp. 2TAB19 TaxID=3233003 RepID=UPI003F99A961
MNVCRLPLSKGFDDEAASSARRQQKAAPSEEQPMLGKWLCAALVHRFTSRS